MNRILHLFLGLSVIAGVASCGKTNVRKLTGDWTVTYDEMTIDKSYGTTTDKSHLLLTETTATSTTEYGFIGATTPYTESGKVTVNNFSIRKDGTWTWNKDYETSDPTYSNRKLLELSGTWSFAAKSGRNGAGFGRRERVVFHTLSSRFYEGRTVIATGEVLPPEWDDSMQFATGFHQMVFVVESSTKDELQLVNEGKNVYVYSNAGQSVQAIAYVNRLSLKH